MNKSWLLAPLALAAVVATAVLVWRGDAAPTGPVIEGQPVAEGASDGARLAAGAEEDLGVEAPDELALPDDFLRAAVGEAETPRALRVQLWRGRAGVSASDAESNGFLREAQELIER